jgi:hypothetical protein
MDSSVTGIFQPKKDEVSYFEKIILGFRCLELTICGFESTIPRITFGVLTRSDTLACSKESPCQVSRVGDFFEFF